MSTPSRAAIVQALRGLALAPTGDVPRCVECRADLRDGARATGLATRDHEDAAFGLARLWCVEHAPGEIPDPTAPREQVLFACDVGAACDVGTQQHWPIPIAPEVSHVLPIERVVTDGGEPSAARRSSPELRSDGGSSIIIGGRNDRGDDGVILHDESGRYGEGDEPRDHDLAEFGRGRTTDLADPPATFNRIAERLKL